MLAMLAVMATSFMMLMRLDTRITRNYVDDQRCELMAYGVINYFKAVLREDLDRTWGRYENRDTGVGFYSRVYKGDGTPDFVRRQIPGVVENVWGTPVSNDFWFSAPWNTWGQSGGNIYASTSTSYYGVTQQSFAWNDKYGQAYGMVGRYRESSGYECDAWIGLSANCRDKDGRIVAENYVGGGTLTPIDDDADGVANAEYVYGSGTAFSRENAVMYNSLYDEVPFVMQAGPTGYQPSEKLTRENALPGGLWWRWGVKIGPTHSSYANLNVHGNLDGADSQWLGNMGGLAGVKARRAVDETSDTWDTGNNSHLGRIEWQGFPDFYDAVMYHPASVSLERLFHRSGYTGYTNSPTLVNDLALDRALARKLIRYRWGGNENTGSGRPGGGDNRRVGWRRDGASFFKFPSPENPLGNDRYFGANEVLEHDHTTDNPTTSAVARILEGSAVRGECPGIAISLWKPVDNAVPLASGKVEDIGGRRYLCVDTTQTIRLIQPYGGSTGRSGPGGAQTAYLGVYRRWDPMNARIFDGGSYGKADSGNVIWCPGWLMANYHTLGRPNIEYKASAYTVPNSTSVYSGKYRRIYERNFKVVDGDLPSIGWLGELMMVNRATDGPLTWVHQSGQDPMINPGSESYFPRTGFSNQLDTKAKFDLYRPFAPAGVYDPDTSNQTLVKCKGLHILDCFTVWDPSNDGIDNDGDGAVDDEDTGLQAGDKGGPEVRVFGLLDLNQIPTEVWATVWPDNRVVRGANKSGYPLYFAMMMRQTQRESSYSEGIGPFETIGDLIRADSINRYPGLWLSGSWWGPGAGSLDEAGFMDSGTSTHRDDDGDGIYDERDERDMMFTWMANYFTTRDNVFEIDVNTQLCEPPYYPMRGGAQVQLPFKAYRSARGYARKQVLGILDRSTCLRVKPDRTCDFTGPVQVRMLRATDDVQVY